MNKKNKLTPSSSILDGMWVAESSLTMDPTLTTPFCQRSLRFYSLTPVGLILRRPGAPSRCLSSSFFIFLANFPFRSETWVKKWRSCSTILRPVIYARWGGIGELPEPSSGRFSITQIEERMQIRSVSSQLGPLSKQRLIGWFERWKKLASRLQLLTTDHFGLSFARFFK